MCRISFSSPVRYSYSQLQDNSPQTRKSFAAYNVQFSNQGMTVTIMQLEQIFANDQVGKNLKEFF